MERIQIALEKNKFTSFFLNKDNFSLIYITACILWFFPLLGWLIDPVCKICFIWGAGLFFWDLLTKRTVFKSVYWFMPILIIALYAVTILLNLKYDFYMGVKHAVYLVISLIILYGQDRKKSFDELKKILYKVNNIIIYIVFVAGIISIVMFIFKISFTFSSGDLTLRQGFLENRLFGVYTSPNTGALFVIISFAAMMMNFVIKNESNKSRNIFYIINAIIQFIYFSLTLSNGGMLTSMVFITILVIACIFPKLMVKKGIIKSVIASALMLALFLGGFKVLIENVRYVMSYIPPIVASLTSDTDKDDPDIDVNEQEDKVKFERIESGDDMSNGRFDIWIGSLKLLKQHPVFGYSDMMTKEGEKVKFDTSVLSSQEETWLYKHNGNLHNAYVHIATYSGLIGFCAFFIFGLLLFKKVATALIRGNKNTQQYKILALLLTVIGAIAANGMVEAHLLYTRQDPYGAIFWLYVGVAALLAEIFEYSDNFYTEKSTDTEKFAFAVDTPLQMLNSVNFVLNNTKGSKNNSDIYIYHQFRGSDKLSKQLKESGVFNNVYDVDVYKKYPSPINKVATIYRLFAPKQAIKSATRGKVHLNKKLYSYVCTSFPTSFTTGMHMAYPRAEVLLIEDGVGSYFGNIVDDYSTGIFKFIDKFFFDNNMSIQPKETYLSNPQLSKNNIDSKICKLEKISDENVDRIERIFNYKENSLYTENRVVYLTQPLDEKEGFVKDNEAKIERIIENVFGLSAVARIHPRHTNVKFEKMSIDNYANLWELECVKQITDENILIGAFSTAQFMPKILKNAEPTIIFTYKLLFKNLNDEFWQETGNFIESFKSLYSDQSKILVPETVEEFEAILKNKCC